MDVGRDDDTFMESRLARDFYSDKEVTVTVNAVILVPNKALIGIVQLQQQEVNEKVPALPLLYNDYKRRNEFRDFIRASCGSRGPFNTIAQTIRTGGKVQDKNRFKTGNVFMGRDSPPITAHLITLEEPFELIGTTEIQY